MDTQTDGGLLLQLWQNKLAKPSTPTTIEAASESAVLANSSAAADATHLSKSVASPAPAALPPPSAEFTVYIDGACSNNGQAGAKAGYGVYWGPNHPLNVAEPVPGPDKHQTNNRAELLAAITVLKAAQTHLEPTAQLTIYSDSQYVLGGVQGWLECWKKSAWQRKGDGTVLNLDLWKELDSCLSIYNRSHRPAIWLWVKGHSGNVGNDQADRHAVLGAAKQRN
ncbi:ribonuclease H-like domain-containing protein [Polychytrium aggregatum]|uniref:ribonuclease H-like domain-containing protein n=1 Tax=Polychytrium aggregatum TaxID=110093 RepID=UPI0022FE8681|nr:ribonuclease H-like domain-containing protein [Polychytrium aggregatum]KAI9206400.1 ribonuclease H-like domain-containing protein [Polychytrium aggregatum]